MGYDSATLRVSASLSRHNSPKDKEHDKLWDEFVSRVTAIAKEEKFQAIYLEVM